MTTTPGLTGLKVAALESRKQEEIARLIEKFGGQAFVSASLREVAVNENRAAIDFAQRLVTGGIDVMIFLTGVGFRHLLTAVEKHVDRQRYLNSLTDIVTICRGPKPVVAMSEVGLKPTHRVPEPNTWRELLATIDAGIPIANQQVGLQTVTRRAHAGTRRRHRPATRTGRAQKNRTRPRRLRPTADGVGPLWRHRPDDFR